MSDKPTKEEVNLCKKIAEKHRKEIEYGDYYFWEVGKEVGLVGQEHRLYIYKGDDYTPLWQISDCLEFLKERYDDVSIGSIQDEWDIAVYDAYDKVHHSEFLEDMRGKTPLEALLKAVLAIIEEKS